MDRMPHRLSEGCEFDPPSGAQYRFSHVRSEPVGRFLMSSIVAQLRWLLNKRY